MRSCAEPARKNNGGAPFFTCAPLDAGRSGRGLECALGAHDVQRVRLHPEPLQSAADWYSQTSTSPYAWTSFRFTAKYCSGDSLIAATVAETYNELLRCRRLPRLRAAFVTPASFGTTARMPY